MALKVVSYNIQEGGEGRLADIAAVLRKLQPDVVALVEAGDRGAVDWLQGELGMEMAYGEANNLVGHIAWLSRLPICHATNHRHPGLAKTLLEIEVSWEGRRLRLHATHLASRWDQPKPVDEDPIILDVLRRGGDGYQLLVGDFNALRPGDPVGTPPNGVEKRGEAVDGAPRDAIRLMLQAGYVDCYRAKHSQSPGYTYPSDQLWLRLDYAFTSPPLAALLRDCDVVQGEEAAAASDHLPIRVEFG